MSVKQWLKPHEALLSEGFKVGRILPFHGGKGVGPFIFLDHMGPHKFNAGQGVDIAPHPHIGLSTLTYLFAGEVEHKDSLGSCVTIRPGDVNWMTSGRGIVHSERTPQAERQDAHSLHGLQAWIGLPADHEEMVPFFQHVEQATLAKHSDEGGEHTLLAGEAFGLKSPVSCFSRLFYVHSLFQAGGTLRFDPDGQEVAIYVIEGVLTIDGIDYEGPGLIHFETGSKVFAQAKSTVSSVLIGGDAFPERRKIWWNFVSTRPERIETAKSQWRERAHGNSLFGQVTGETDFIPLP